MSPSQGHWLAERTPPRCRALSHQENTRRWGSGKKQGLDTRIGWLHHRRTKQLHKRLTLSCCQDTPPTGWTGFLKTEDKQASSPGHCPLGSCGDPSKINQGSIWKPTCLNQAHRSMQFPSQKSYLGKQILQLSHVAAAVFPLVLKQSSLSGRNHSI